MENVLKTTKADEKALLEAESRYCSYGDTVHYLEPAKLFAGCNGSFLYDYEDKPYLDLQMWYSAVNFGYANPRLNDALKRQIDTLPQGRLPVPAQGKDRTRRHALRIHQGRVGRRGPRTLQRWRLAGH